MPRRFPTPSTSGSSRPWSRPPPAASRSWRAPARTAPKRPCGSLAGRPSAGPTPRWSSLPYYNKPTQEGFYQHFKALAEAVDIPICVYNIPGRTGKNIEPDTIVRMAELPNITMVKEASGSMDAASQIIAKTDLTLLSGDDSLTLPLMSLGGRGVVSVVGNIVPRDVIAMLRAFESGNLAEARCLHFKLFPLCRDMLGLSTNPIPIKAAMEMLGQDTGDLRMPLTPAFRRRDGKAAEDAGGVWIEIIALESRRLAFAF